MNFRYPVVAAPSQWNEYGSGQTRLLIERGSHANRGARYPELLDKNFQRRNTVSVKSTITYLAFYNTNILI